MKTFNSAIMILGIVLGSGLTMRADASSEDQRIEDAAKNSYTFKHSLKNDHVNVKSSEGAVVLTGTVSESYHQTLATETVSSLPGVKSVTDNLKIKNKHSENTDAWLFTKVKTALLFHRNVSSLTEVTVQNSVVTLRGKASSDAEKDLTGEYVKDVEGVKDVKNEMTVKASAKKKESMGDKIDDASVTAQVKVALLAHRSTSAIKTHVETNAGTVTLSGKAANGAEKDLVTKIVSDIDGVKKVDNNMTY